MSTPVWLLDLRGQVELPEGTFELDGVVVRPSDRALLGIGVKTGLFTKRTLWASADSLIRSNGQRAWLAAQYGDLNARPPEGVWVRADLPIRQGTTHLGTIGWVGVTNGVVVELGVTPVDPRVLPRRIKGDAIEGLNDRSVVVHITDFESEPLLKTDPELEEEVRRRLWETTGSVPSEALERITVNVNGGVVTLGGMVPKNDHRGLALRIAEEPLDVRGVIDHIETAEGIAASRQSTS